jgi:hypothetical protein
MKSPTELVNIIRALSTEMGAEPDSYGFQAADTIEHLQKRLAAESVIVDRNKNARFIALTEAMEACRANRCNDCAQDIKDLRDK